MESFTSFWFMELRNDSSALGRKNFFFKHITIFAKSKKFSKSKNDKL